MPVKQAVKQIGLRVLFLFLLLQVWGKFLLLLAFTNETDSLPISVSFIQQISFVPLLCTRVLATQWPQSIRSPPSQRRRIQTMNPTNKHVTIYYENNEGTLLGVRRGKQEHRIEIEIPRFRLGLERCPQICEMKSQKRRIPEGVIQRKVLGFAFPSIKAASKSASNSSREQGRPFL